MNLVRLFSRVLKQEYPTSISIISRSYYTNRVKKATLYSQISPLGNPKTAVLPVLDDWLRRGNKVRVAELQRIIRDLRKRKRFNQALQVSEWMNNKGICVFSATEHAVHLDLTGRVHGFVAAEGYFNRLKEQFKTDKTYGALLNCYVRQQKTDESLSHFQKMREMGFASSPLTYNNIMCLYTNTDHHEKVPGVLAAMKESDLAPDNYSYRICINAYGVRSDIDGMERTLEEMESQPHIAMDWNTYAVAAKFYVKAGFADKAINLLKKAEAMLENKDGTGYNHLISLYASLQNKAEVLRLWDLEKDACKRRINKDYITMLQALVKLSAVEEAEEVLKEWESSGNCYDSRVPNIVILGHAGNGSYNKAEAMLQRLVEEGKGTFPNTWGNVAEGYMEKGQPEKAFGCMKAAIGPYTEDKRWKPAANVVAGILRWLGDEGSLEDVEDFVALVRARSPVKPQMYYALIKASKRCGRNVGSILQRMRADNIDEDEEIKRILA